MTISEFMIELYKFRIQLGDVELYEAVPEYGEIPTSKETIRIETTNYPKENNKKEYKLVIGHH